MIGAGGDLDLANITGLGVGAVLLALVFRTLWRQEGGWRSVLQASREDAAAARKDAAEARVDAAAARDDARVARANERECLRRLGAMQAKLDELTETTHRSARRLDAIDSGEHRSLPPATDDGA